MCSRGLCWSLEEDSSERPIKRVVKYTESRAKSNTTKVSDISRTYWSVIQSQTAISLCWLYQYTKQTSKKDPSIRKQGPTTWLTCIMFGVWTLSQKKWLENMFAMGMSLTHWRPFLKREPLATYRKHFWEYFQKHTDWTTLLLRTIQPLVYKVHSKDECE